MIHLLNSTQYNREIDWASFIEKRSAKIHEVETFILLFDLGNQRENFLISTEVVNTEAERQN